MAKRTKRQLPQELRSLGQAAKEQQAEVRQLFEPPEVIEADTRRKLAERFLWAYFALLFILIVGIPIYNLVAYRVADQEQSLQIPLSDILQTYSAIVGPTLGFVIAYYFKSKNET
jgi:type VI protein secretion system component VasF